MPLFAKRSRSLSTTRPIQPASSSAHLAAAQAFLAAQPSQSNISASAAAAALRTMSPPPQPIDQIQTKRMLNRQASNSSALNSPRGRPVGTMQRRQSSGSMTERTFRSPSPAQTPLQPAARSRAPPVPALPKTYSEDLPPIPQARHRRSASVDTPPSTRPAGRGQYVNQVDRVSSAATAAARKTVNAPPLTAPSQQMTRSDSQDSRNSYNFSYPRGSRPSSPPPKSPIVSADEVMPVPAANGISAFEAAKIQHQITETAAKPVKKKKKRVEPSLVQGSHLQSGTMGGKPTVTPLEPLPADYVPPRAQPVPKPKKKAALTGQSSHFPEHSDASIATEQGPDPDAVSESPKDKRALRASGALAKQPSVVREDWEGEQGEQEEQTSSPVEAAQPVRIPSGTVTAPAQPKKTLPEANMSRKIDEPSSMTKSLSPTGEAVTQGKLNAVEAPKALRPTSSEAQSARVASVSPSRSTRFSDRLASDMVSGRKHEPLGRSVSPAKSALKHSTASDASSPTDPRFPGRRGSSVTPSEASDASDGFSTTRRRSVARVSFEESVDTKDLPPDTRFSKEPNKKIYTGLSKVKSSNIGAVTAGEDDVEEGMKPRPALPSFGSVRRGDRSASPTGKPVTAPEGAASYAKSASSSESSSIADPPTMDTSISSDHALGGLLYRESQKENVPNRGQTDEKVLPSTTERADQVGYESDTDSVYSDDDDQKTFQAAQTASRELGKTIGNEHHLLPYRDEIPVIAVQPATPGLDESGAGDDWGVGSQANTAEFEDDSGGPRHARTTNGYSSWDSPTSPSSQQLLPIAEEDSDDNENLYSDAAEDVSDLEGDGFGSINAIIESPIAASQPARVVSPPETPLAQTSQQRPAERARKASWDNAEAHWSGLAQRARDDNQQPAEVLPAPAHTSFNRAVTQDVSVEKEAPIMVQKSQPASPQTPRVTKQAPSEAPATTVVATKRVSPPVKAQEHLKTSMREKPKPATAVSQGTQGQLRSSLRDRAEPVATAATNQGHLRSSMRAGTEAPVATMRTRPNSYAGAPSPPRAALQKKHIPPAPVAAPRSPPPLRRFSNDSDSDSSFRRARRSRKPADNKYTMKRSMRSGPSEPARPSAPAGRGGVRSLSPPADRRPTSPMGTRTFRTSMRGSTDAAPTLRPKPEAKRSSSLFSRNRTAKSPTRPSTAIAAIPNKVKPRTTGSDDEATPRPKHFKSRFADSSDEDEPKTFRPVRGIPRKKDEGDSTDLDDSSDEEARNARSSQKKLAVVPPPQSPAVTSPPGSPTTAKKRGLWSRLRGKKKEEEEGAVTPPVAAQTIGQREGLKENIEAGKKSTKDAEQLGFESAAERDALVEQTRLKLEAANERPSSPVDRPTSSSGNKLQRRVTPQRMVSDSFSEPRLPPPLSDFRPQTSDGVPRPTMGSRQPTSEKVNGDIISAKTGKKKKFGFLRKAFGLND